MARQRVLHLADSPYVGGITSHILSVAEAFRDDPDWEIVLATLPGTRSDDTLLERARAARLEISTIAMASTFDLQVRARLREFVDTNRIAVVHTHGYRGNVIANLSRLPVPIVTTSHGLAVQPPMRMRLWQAMHLRFMRQQPNVLACSEFVARQLQDKGVPKERIDVVRNACPDATHDTGAIARSEFGIAPEAVVALYVGRLDGGKRLDLVMDAMNRLPHLHLLVVGDGPTRGALQRAAHATGAKVSFVGVQSDPGPFYALADVVVLPTELEALPMTLIEAAAYGKPAIASNVGGVPEVIDDGVTGMLVDAPDAWADAFSQLSDAETRAAMGRAARGRHRECFSLDVLRRSLAEVYGRVTAQ